MTTTQQQIETAAAVVYGTKPTSASALQAARAVVFSAARAGWKFFPNAGGSAAEPRIVVQAPTAA